MNRPRMRKRLVSIVISSVLGVVAAVSACSNNGEGERCQVENLNEDCQNGLTCTPKQQLQQQYAGSDRCCPPDRALATEPACKLGTGTIGTNPPSEGGTSDATTTDAADAADAAETSTDAATDASDAADADDAG